MKPELFWLALTATMTGLFWIPYILNRAFRRGIPAAFQTPRMEEASVEAEWAQRARRAHSNAVENLVVFTALFAGADAVFAHAVGVVLPEIDLGTLPARAVLGALVAGFALAAAFTGPPHRDGTCSR